MAAKDLFNQAVKRALLNKQWQITADPFKGDLTQQAIKIYQVKLIIYNPLQEVIVQWKN